jgi:hypothetical protein
MALFDLDGYSGNAEILGSLRRVVFDRGNLTIQGLSLYETNRLLSILATGKLTGIQPGDGREAEAAKEVMGAAEAPPGDGEETSPEQSPPSGSQAAEGAQSDGKDKRKRRTKEEVEAEKKAKAEAKAAKEKAAKEKAAKEKAAKEKAAKEKAAAEAGEDEAGEDEAPPDKGSNGKGGDDAELIVKLAAQRKLRDALNILVGEGYKTLETIIEKATELKADVPVFDRCVDIRERVTRIGDSLGITA